MCRKRGSPDASLSIISRNGTRRSGWPSGLKYTLLDAESGPVVTLGTFSSPGRVILFMSSPYMDRFTSRPTPSMARLREGWL
jgi:hypothetical protein